MRKLILMALAGAIVMPGLAAPAIAAPLPDRHDGRHDGRDFRDDRRDHRDDRRDFRDDRRDYGRDHRWGDNDWRDYRSRNRSVYARGGWRAPFGYYGFRAGGRIRPAYYGSRYLIADPWRYRLPPVGAGLRYVRHYDDVLVVDVRRGVVVRVYNNFYW